MQYIATVNSAIPCSLGTNFGQLSLWVRLSCRLDKIKNFKAQRGIVSEDIYQEPMMKRIKKRLTNESDSFYSTTSSIESIKRKKQKSRDESSEDQERFMGVSEKIGNAKALEFSLENVQNFVDFDLFFLLFPHLLHVHYNINNYKWHDWFKYSKLDNVTWKSFNNSIKNGTFQFNAG